VRIDGQEDIWFVIACTMLGVLNRKDDPVQLHLGAPLISVKVHNWLKLATL
jgi:hypothetical protein